MGRDKALLPYRGRTLVEWVAGQAREAAGEVHLVGAPERYDHLEIPCIAERYAGCGPLSGIEAALREGGAEWSLVLACDMPGVDAPFLKELLAGIGPDVDVVVAVDPAASETERIQPLCAVDRADAEAGSHHPQCAVERADADDERLHTLCAVYSSASLPAVQRALAAGSFAVRDVLRTLRIRRVTAPSRPLVRNVNTDEEWAAWTR